MLNQRLIAVVGVYLFTDGALSTRSLICSFEEVSSVLRRIIIVQSCQHLAYLSRNFTNFVTKISGCRDIGISHFKKIWLRFE